jgi:predicted DsbA family dithiol-disulfide isomerase
VIRIDVIADTICPWCLIGKRRLERALAMRENLAVDINWLPYQLNPTIAPEGVDNEIYLAAKFGGAESARHNLEQIRKIGLDEGLDFAFENIKITPNTVKSHALINFSSDFKKEKIVVERLYSAYFFESQDIGDLSVLRKLADECGLDPAAAGAYLDSADARAAVIAREEQTRQRGVHGIPCFLVENEYAISGAQSPEIFLQIFDLVTQDRNSSRTPGNSMSVISPESAT